MGLSIFVLGFSLRTAHSRARCNAAGERLIAFGTSCLCSQRSCPARENFHGRGFVALVRVSIQGVL
jgi:hypothetical protein